MINSIIINYDEGDSDVFVKQVPAPAPVTADPFTAADADLPVEAPVEPAPEVAQVEPAPEVPVEAAA